MHTLSPWTAGALGLVLAGSSLACSPATDGLGGDPAADDPGDHGDIAADSDDDSGYDQDHDDSNDDSLGEDDGDPEPRACVDPRAGYNVVIELLGQNLGEGFGLTDCSEPIFQARVATADTATFGLYACDCEAEPMCFGDKFQLTAFVPGAEWQPGLEVGDCYWFHVFSEEIEPGVCRRSRVDISESKQGKPWFAAGSGREDLAHNGLAVEPIPSSSCADDCGEWRRRELLVSVGDELQTLGWGESAEFGDYQVKHWRSYVTPDGCGEPGEELTTWSAISLED